MQDFFCLENVQTLFRTIFNFADNEIKSLSIICVSRFSNDLFYEFMSDLIFSTVRAKRNLDNLDLVMISGVYYWNFGFNFRPCDKKTILKLIAQNQKYYEYNINIYAK